MATEDHGEGGSQTRAARAAGPEADLVIANLIPSDTPDYMVPAWIGCLQWAIATPEIVAAFRAETGNRWTPGRTGLEQLIDSATGVDRDFIEAFVRWVNVNVWGPVDGAAQDDGRASGV